VINSGVQLICSQENLRFVDQYGRRFTLNRLCTVSLPGGIHIDPQVGRRWMAWLEENFREYDQQALLELKMREDGFAIIFVSSNFKFPKQVSPLTISLTELRQEAALKEASDASLETFVNALGVKAMARMIQALTNREVTVHRQIGERISWTVPNLL